MNSLAAVMCFRIYGQINSATFCAGVLGEVKAPEVHALLWCCFTKALQLDIKYRSDPT